MIPGLLFISFMATESQECCDINVSFKSQHGAYDAERDSRQGKDLVLRVRTDIKLATHMADSG